jgi:hypothetical protein
VTARTPVDAQALGRTAFLGVIAENTRSAEIADRLVHERLPDATLAP